MMNIIRGDIYRVSRGKSIYITLAVLLAIIILQVVAGAFMDTVFYFDESVSTEITIDTTESSVETEVDTFQRPFGIEAPFFAMTLSGGILLILFPILIFVSTADFSSGAVKNTLAGGMTRLKYYGTKLIFSCVICALMLLVYVLLSTLFATVITGFGGTVSLDFISKVTQVFLFQLLIWLAVTCVMHFFIFLVRSKAVIGVFIAYLIIPSFILFLLSFINSWFEKLIVFDLPENLARVVEIAEMPSGDITKIILISIGYIIIATIGGYLVFRRAEIK